MGRIHTAMFVGLRGGTGHKSRGRGAYPQGTPYCQSLTNKFPSQPNNKWSKYRNELCIFIFDLGGGRGRH